LASVTQQGVPRCEFVRDGHVWHRCWRCLLPRFYLGAPGERVAEEELAYYETALKRAAQLKLPITFVSTLEDTDEPWRTI
jgi:hypothetical protein